MGRNPSASALGRLMSLNTPTAGRPVASTRRIPAALAAFRELLDDAAA